MGIFGRSRSADKQDGSFVAKAMKTHLSSSFNRMHSAEHPQRVHLFGKHYLLAKTYAGWYHYVLMQRAFHEEVKLINQKAQQAPGDKTTKKRDGKRRGTIFGHAANSEAAMINFNISLKRKSTRGPGHDQPTRRSSLYKLSKNVANIFGKATQSSAEAALVAGKPVTDADATAPPAAPRDTAAPPSAPAVSQDAAAATLAAAPRDANAAPPAAAAHVGGGQGAAHAAKDNQTAPLQESEAPPDPAAGVTAEAATAEPSSSFPASRPGTRPAIGASLRGTPSIGLEVDKVASSMDTVLSTPKQIAQTVSGMFSGLARGIERASFADQQKPDPHPEALSATTAAAPSAEWLELDKRRAALANELADAERLCAELSAKLAAVEQTMKYRETGPPAPRVVLDA